MRIVIVMACACSLVGCRQLLGLDEPVLRMDATDADTALLDAPVHSRPDTPALACPLNYTLTLAGSSSKYRFINTTGVFAVQHAVCNDDLPGGTHLASLETVQEIAGVKTQIGATLTYVGGVQARDQVAVDVGWFSFSGAALPSAWDNGEPKDAPTAGEGNEQNLVALGTTGLRDVPESSSFAALCECDGITIDSTVASYLP